MAILSVEQQLLLSANLLLAAVLAAIIGVDRAQGNRPAGIRTHMLIGTGAALFTTLSIYAFPDDPARVTSDIVSGVGFLGAGSIIRSGTRTVRGITTAAGIWVVAAIGVACGTGSYILAITTTVLAWFVLAVLGRVKDAGYATRYAADENMGEEEPRGTA